jgi:hypothetical protein
MHHICTGPDIKLPFQDLTEDSPKAEALTCITEICRHLPRTGARSCAATVVAKPQLLNKFHFASIAELGNRVICEARHAHYLAIKLGLFE